MYEEVYKRLFYPWPSNVQLYADYGSWIVKNMFCIQILIDMRINLQLLTKMNDGSSNYNH